ncbi:hypothetical protein IJT93_03955 [bacterium]|nr:hypothetical protein [bacterium]
MKSETTKFVKAVIALFKSVPHLDEAGSKPFCASDLLAQNGVFVTEAAQKALPSIGVFSSFIAKTHGYDLKKANAGLFDTFAAVKAASPKEYFYNQVLHYFSVYMQNGFDDRDTQGVDASLVYIHPRELQLPEGEPIRIIVIGALSDEEIIRRTKEMIGSGMALSENTLNFLMDVVSRFKSFFSLSDAANKEFRIRMIDLLGIMPKKPIDLLRYIALKKIGSAMIVHSEQFIRDLIDLKGRFNAEPALAAFVEQNGVEAIAREFNRHRKIWLALRHDGPQAARIINRARRLSEKLNQPAVVGVLDRIGDASVSLEEVKKELAKVTVFKKVSLANSLLRMAEDQSSRPDCLLGGRVKASLYTVRTGRSFVGLSLSRPFTAERSAIKDAVIASILSDIRPAVEGKHVLIPAEMDYAFPTSEKQFMGPIPALSSLSLPKNVIVGIHWLNALNDKGKEDRVDLDLHYTSNKIHVGWDTDFESEERKLVLFSGDMTNAPRPEGAAEVFYISDAVEDDFAALSVNKYTHNSEAIPFSVFFGKSETNNPDQSYLISRQELCVHINGLEIDHPGMIVGFIESGKDAKTLHFVKTALGDNIVTRCDSNMKYALNAIRSMLRTRLSLKYILGLAGASFEPKEDGSWDIDLSLNALTADSFSFLTAKPKA